MQDSTPSDLGQHINLASAMAAAAAELDEQLAIGLQEDSESDMQSEQISEAAIDSKTLRGAAKPKTAKIVRKEAARKALTSSELTDQFSQSFASQTGNIQYRLPVNVLKSLAKQLGTEIHEEIEPDELIALVTQQLRREINPDACHIHKVLQFLKGITQASLAEATPEERIRLEKIQEVINTTTDQYAAVHEDEIKLAEKLIGAANAVVDSTKSQMDVKEVLDRYRSFIHSSTPPDIQVLRRYYEKKGYATMQNEFEGLGKFIGANLKRMVIENPELVRFGKGVRLMQAVQGVFRQAKATKNACMSYLRSQGFENEARQKELSEVLNFQQVAKLFFDIIEDRSPTPEKIKQFGANLVKPLSNDPTESTILNIAVLNMIRAMISEVSPNYVYQSMQQRDVIKTGVITVLDHLEDKLEELQE